MTDPITDHPPGPAKAPLSLAGQRLIGADLSTVVLRGAEIDGADIDAPWLLEGGTLIVNGIDVVPYINAELNRRFPGREGKDADSVAGLRDSWAAAKAAWATTVDEAQRQPAGTLDRRVNGEWSIAETMRHLVMATDVWLRKAILNLDQPFHPIGVANPEAEADGLDLSLLSLTDPSFDQVLQARTDRQDQVDAFLDQTTDQHLDDQRPNPWAPQYPETVRSCLQTILTEEWEHLRYTRRDLTPPANGETA